MWASFFSGLLANAVNAAAKGAASAGDSGADIRTVGVAAGASALIGVTGYSIQFLLAHPLGQHPAVAASVAATTARVAEPITVK